MRPITCPNCLHEIRKPHGRPKIDNQTRQSIRNMRRMGMTLRALADVHDVSCGTVHRVIHEKENKYNLQIGEK